MFRKIILPLALLSSFASAFISLDPPVMDERRGWDGEIGISGAYSSGNSDTSSVGFSAKAEYHQERWMIYSLAAYHYGEANDDKNTNDGLAHLRYIHRIYDTPYDYELFVQSEFNEFQDVKMRNLAGANIRRNFSGFFDKCYVGLGLFYSYMEPDVISEIDPIYKRTKMNSYLSLVKKVNPYFSITYLGFYQPNVEDFSDYRVSQIIQFDTTLTENMTLGIDISHRYNATPYHRIEKTDIRSLINLKYKLK